MYPTINTTNDNLEITYNNLEINDILILNADISYICEFVNYIDKYSGTPEYYNIIKEYKIGNSDWKLLDEIDECVEHNTLQIRLSSLPIIPDYNTIIDIPIISNNGWVDINYIFDRDYYDNLTYTLLYDSVLHYNNDTNKYVIKNNGYWSSPFVINIVDDIIYPSNQNGINITHELINNCTVSSNYPINDTILTNNIRFGKDFNNAVFKLPNKNDKLFIYLSEYLSGGEIIRIDYTPRTIEHKYLILDYLKINATIKYPEFNYDYSVISIEPNSTITYKHLDILKVYTLCEICIISNIPINTKFRYSFNSRYWESDWINIDKLNCIRFSPLKYFYIEFLFENNTNDIIHIYDIELIGNIDNITKNAQNLGRFGIRSDCDYTNYELPNVWKTELCPTKPTYNPYDVTSLPLYEKIANDINDIYGHEVNYFRVVPDDSGIDTVLHEYGVYTKVDEAKLKVVVPQNQFPEERIEFNIFDLAFFDSFEIHITKQEFYNIFGVGNRPSKNDYLFFCAINKWYRVEHALSFREFQNSSVYYKVILMKKSDDKNINNGGNSIFEESISNNSLESLFGKTVTENINKVVNKQIQEDITEQYTEDYKDELNIEVDNNILDISKPDKVKYKSFVNVIEDDIVNNTTIIAKSYYDLKLRDKQLAVQYITDTDYSNCSKRAITLWFNIQQYIQGSVYNLIDNYNSNTNNGYRIDFIDGRLEIIYFGQTFDFDVLVSPNKWYGLVVNIYEDKLEYSLHRRFSEINCKNSKLEMINTDTVDIQKGNVIDTSLKLHGSYIYWTNFRLFNEIIPLSERDRILNQIIVKDTDLLIVSDNADINISTRSHKF